MRYVCIILGLLTGKWRVKCTECKHLDAEQKCYGHTMPQDVVSKEIACGFWSKK